jgi:hypothetical protein
MEILRINSIAIVNEKGIAIFFKKKAYKKGGHFNGKK